MNFFEEISFTQSEFFKYILLEKYLDSDMGSDPVDIGIKFAKFMNYFGYNSNDFVKYFSQSSSIINSERSELTIEKIKSKNSYYLLAGWLNEGKGGHAISFYIEYLREKDRYNFYIINSGRGLEHHGLTTDELKPIIILYEDVDSEKMSDILLLNKFFLNTSRSLMIQKYINRRTNEFEGYDKTKEGYFNYNLYTKNNKKVDEKLYYGFINEILKIKPKIVFRDKQQIVGTCAYHSTYYFLKYFIFKDESKFDKFINDIRILLLNCMPKMLDNIIKENRIIYNNIIEISNLLIKDYEFDRKNELKEKILKIYENIDNSFVGVIENGNLEKSTIYDVSVEQITNKIYLDTLKEIDDKIKRSELDIELLFRVNYNRFKDSELRTKIMEILLLNKDKFKKISKDFNSKYTTKIDKTKYYIEKEVDDYYDDYGDYDDDITDDMKDVDKERKKIEKYLEKTKDPWKIEDDNTLIFNNYFESITDSRNFYDIVIMDIILSNIIEDEEIPISQEISEIFNVTDEVLKEMLINIQYNIFDDRPNLSFCYITRHINYQDFLTKIIKYRGLVLKWFKNYFFVKKIIDSIEEIRDIEKRQKLYNEKKRNDMNNLMDFYITLNNHVEKIVNDYNQGNEIKPTINLFNIIGQFKWSFIANDDKTYSMLNKYINLKIPNIFKIIEIIILKLDMNNIVKHFINKVRLTEIDDQILYLIHMVRKDEFVEKINEIDSDSKIKNNVLKNIYYMVKKIPKYNAENMHELRTLIFISFYGNDQMILEKNIEFKIMKEREEIYEGYKLEPKINDYEQIKKYKIYSKEGLLYYKKNTNYLNIKANSGIIMNDNKMLISPLNYKDFIEHIESQNSNYKLKTLLIKKVLFSTKSNVNIWYIHETKQILIDIINIELEMEINLENKCYFINNKNDRYEILEKYEFLEGLTMTFLNNGFLIKHNNKKHLLIIMRENFLDLIKEEYFCNTKKDIKTFSQYNILELGYNDIIINNNNINDLISLLLSFIVSKNDIGITLIINTLRTLLLNNDENKYNLRLQRQTKELPKIDFSRWFMYYSENSEIDTGDIYERDKSEEEKRGISNLKVNNLKKYNISELLTTEEYKLINDLSEKINQLKDNDLKEEYKTNDILYEFIDKVRTLCLKSAKVDLHNDIKKIKDHIIIEDKIRCLKEENKEEIINSIYDDSLNNFSNLINYYDKNYKKLYKIMALQNFYKAYQGLKMLDVDDIHCGNILKVIELVDPNLIYKIENERSLSEMIFELQTGFFIRDSQKQILNKINKDIENKIFDKTYEILMGQGKTSTLTPLLILENYFNKKYDNFNIIIPNHLVEQSYDIMTKFLNILDYDVLIYKGKGKYSELINSINVIDCNEYKKYILDIINDYPSSEEIKKMYIFDEIDSLIDPLKSELNIPDRDKIDHPKRNEISGLIFEILKVKNQLNPKKNNMSHNVKIKLNEEIIYSTNISEKQYAEFLENKMNSTLNLVNNMIINKDYGYGIFKGYEKSYESFMKKNRTYFTAIPYSAVNKPLDESQFSDFELFLFLTINCYILNGLRVNDIYSLMLNINDKMGTGILLDSILIKIGIKKEEVKVILKNITDTDIVLDECKKILITKKNDIKLIEFYLKNIIIPEYFKINEYQTNITTIDLFNKEIASNKITFSGTVNFYKPSEILNTYVKEGENEIFDEICQSLITNIEEDKFAKGSVISSIYGALTIFPENIVYKQMENIELEEEFLKYFFDNIDRYDSLIDQGGLILNKKTIELVNLIGEKKPDRKILFVNDNNERMILNEDKTITKYNNEIFNNLFIYYDHKNTIGTDFKQPNNMKGIITMREDDKLTNMAQALFRLRNINVGHTIDFFYPYNVIRDILKEKYKFDVPELDSNIKKIGYYFTAGQRQIKNSEIIYDYLQKSEEKYKNNTLSNLKVQVSKYILRYLNFEKESFEEDLYYDLIQYKDSEDNDVYLSKNDFNKEYVIKYINNILKAKFGINIKTYDIESNDNKIGIQQEVQVQVQVKTEVQKNIKIEINQTKLDDLTISMIDKNFEVDPFESIDDCFEVNFYGCNLNDLLKIKEYKLSLSPLILLSLVKRKELEKPFKWGRRGGYIGPEHIRFDRLVPNLYIKNNEILLCTNLETAMYFNYIKQMTLMDQPIIIDIYGKEIYNPTKKIIKDLNILKYYLLDINEEYIDLYENISNIYKLDNLYFIKNNFFYKIFSYYNKKEIKNFELLPESYLDIKSWINILSIGEEIIRIIINSYILKYKIADNKILVDDKPYDLNKLNINLTDDNGKIIIKIINDIPINDESIDDKLALLSKVTNYKINYDGTMLLYTKLKDDILENLS